MPNPIDLLLARLSAGDREALDLLMPLVYGELHRIAEAYLRREPQPQTLQPTGLVHEAYLRMVEYGMATCEDRAHFYGVAARIMRQILVDHARARRAAKRNAGLPLEGKLTQMHGSNRALAALDDALTALAADDPWKAHLIELRFFGGMSAEEIASLLGKPLHVVRRDLRIARAWLRREIGGR